MSPTGIELELPGGERRTFHTLLLDFSGTLALDGALIEGVAERLCSLSAQLRIVVATADTCGTARDVLRGLPVELLVIGSGEEKAAFAHSIGARETVAIGNGRNDVPVLIMAGLSIAVLGPEGASGELLATADLVVRNIADALDLLAQPLRVKAGLRD